MERLWEFEKRSIEYITIGYNKASYEKIEDMREKCKIHRNTSEIERKYLDDDLMEVSDTEDVEESSLGEL
jgi:hypothetical protein